MVEVWPSKYVHVLYGKGFTCLVSFFCQVNATGSACRYRILLLASLCRHHLHLLLGNIIFVVQIKEPLSLLNAIIRVSLWHEPLLGDRIFLGQVNLSISSMKILPLTHDGWHWLCPRPLPPGKVNMPTDLGSLRIAMHLSQDVIFPVAVYDPLLQLLVRGLDSPVSVWGYIPGGSDT